MPQSPLPFIKGNKVGKETDYRDALPVNMYAVPEDIFDAKGYMILNYGLSAIGDGVTPCRGAFYNDRLGNNFRVHGNTFVEMDEEGNVNFLGNVLGYDSETGESSPVTMDYSFNTQAVLSANQFFLYDPVGGYRQVTDPDLGNPIDFIWIDGYYFFTDGETLYHTLVTDEEAIDPLDFGVSQFTPDKPKGLGKTQDDKVIVFGRYSTEYFVNDATENFAFQRVQSRQVKSGIVATHLKVELNNKWYFVGGNREEGISVHILGVGATQKVATREIEKILAEYTEPELVNAHMESYVIERNSFVKIHLPNHTLLFNETASEKFGINFAWSLLKSDVTGDNPDRSTYPVFDVRVGKWIVGDLLDGRIGYFNNEEATQYGEIIEWILFSPFAYLDGSSIDELELETISGFTADNDATVFLSLTYDGNFYGAEDTIEYGMINEYGRRFIARRLGYIRDFFSIRLRGATRSRMAFARGIITHG